MELHSWNGLQWSQLAAGTAYCPKHKGMQLDVKNTSGYVVAQHSNYGHPSHQTTFICPVDSEEFVLGEGIYALRRRFAAFADSRILKQARVVDLDNIYTPILKVKPKPKDNRYSIQVEIDETPQGKKLVIYAADRQAEGKTQIFIDPQTDKISFDSNDLHPNMVFAKVVAYFKDNKQIAFEQGKSEVNSD